MWTDDAGNRRRTIEQAAARGLLDAPHDNQARQSPPRSRPCSDQTLHLGRGYRGAPRRPRRKQRLGRASPAQGRVSHGAPRACPSAGLRPRKEASGAARHLHGAVLDHHQPPAATAPPPVSRTAPPTPPPARTGPFLPCAGPALAARAGPGPRGAHSSVWVWRGERGAVGRFGPEPARQMRTVAGPRLGPPPPVFPASSRASERASVRACMRARVSVCACGSGGGGGGGGGGGWMSWPVFP